MIIKNNTCRRGLLTDGKKIVLEEILEYLKNTYNCRKDKDLAALLGVSPQNICQWKSGSLSGKRSVAKLIKAIICHSLKMSYDPIAEILPIQIDHKDCMVIGRNKIEQKKIKTQLEETKGGIYLFYDSLGKAIYAGKTSKQTLWKEIGNAFYRERSAQKFYKFSNKQIRKQQYYLYEVAHYVSAYSVHKDAIKDFEALIIRAFPNDLTNVRIEKKSLSFDNQLNAKKVKKR